MKTTIRALAVVLLAALAVQQQQQLARAYIACPDMRRELEPCLSFLQGGSSTPPLSSAAPTWASSTRFSNHWQPYLYAAGRTTTERRATCECVKIAYNQVQAQLSAAQALPDDCGVSLPYAIIPDDCSTVE